MYCFRLAIDNEFIDSLQYGSYEKVLNVFFDSESTLGVKSKFIMYFLKASEQLELGGAVNVVLEELEKKCKMLEEGDYLAKLSIVMHDIAKKAKIEVKEAETGIDMLKIIAIF